MVTFPGLHGPGQQAQPAQLQIPDILPPTNVHANNDVVTLGSTTAQSTTTNHNPQKNLVFDTNQSLGVLLLHRVQKKHYPCFGPDMDARH
jgi:hypothetical protein